jgi:hypothetical protein
MDLSAETRDSSDSGGRQEAALSLQASYRMTRSVQGTSNQAVRNGDVGNEDPRHNSTASWCYGDVDEFLRARCL